MYCQCGCLDLTQDYVKIKNLPEDEFLNLAKQQCKKHPDLLKITDEEGVIQSFYDYYKRKLVKK